MPQAQAEFRKRIRAELSRAFVQSGRELTPETRRQFALAALSIVAAELGRPPDDDLRRAISRWAWNLCMDDKEQHNPYGQKALRAVAENRTLERKRPRRARSTVNGKASRVKSVEQRENCRVYRLRFGDV